MDIADRLRALEETGSDPATTATDDIADGPPEVPGDDQTAVGTEEHERGAEDPPSDHLIAPPLKPVPPQPPRQPAPPRLVRHPESAAWTEAKRTVRGLVLEELAPRMDGLHGSDLEAEVRDTLDRILRRQDVSISPIERRAFVSEMISDTLGFGPLDELLSDPSVSEVMCNGFEDIWVEREGRLEPVDIAFVDEAQYHKVIERIVARVGRRVDEASPMVDARLPDGSRVNVIIPPLALRGAALTIRRFSKDAMTAMDLVDRGTYTVDLVTVLEACVRGRLNLVISGGTGTGKTTTLNVMSSFIPDGERIVTIEDAAELQLQQRHIVALEARPANAEGRGEVRIRELVRNALRMRPDRIIVGECRGAEALDMLQAMNTGHEGSMTTVHANTPRDALSRMETMVLMAGFDLPVRAIREQIASAIDVIVQVDRRPDGRRVVASVAEVQGMEGDKILVQEVFATGRDRQGAPAVPLPTGLRPHFLETLLDRSVTVPASVFRRPTDKHEPGR